jgi:RHS repeat-associated protein
MGNPVAQHSYTFDSQDRLVYYTDHGATNPVTYRYHDDGKLAQVIDASRTTDYRYDGVGRLVQQDFDTTRLTYAYNVMGLESMTLSVDGVDPVRYYYEFNPHGDTQFLVDEEGDIAATYHYDAWGRQRTEGDASLIALNPFTFAGQSGALYYPHMGMYHMGVRWYDPDQQRFVSPDPLGTDSTKVANAYAYGGNDPVNYIDSTGLAARPVQRLNSSRPVIVPEPAAVLPAIPDPSVIPNEPRPPLVVPPAESDPEEASLRTIRLPTLEDYKHIVLNAAAGEEAVGTAQFNWCVRQTLSFRPLTCKRLMASYGKVLKVQRDYYGDPPKPNQLAADAWRHTFWQASMIFGLVVRYSHPIDRAFRTVQGLGDAHEKDCPEYKARRNNWSEEFARGLCFEPQNGNKYSDEDMDQWNNGVSRGIIAKYIYTKTPASEVSPRIRTDAMAKLGAGESIHLNGPTNATFCPQRRCG